MVSFWQVHVRSHETVGWGTDQRPGWHPGGERAQPWVRLCPAWSPSTTPPLTVNPLMLIKWQEKQVRQPVIRSSSLKKNNMCLCAQYCETRGIFQRHECVVSGMPNRFTSRNRFCVTIGENCEPRCDQLMINFFQQRERERCGLVEQMLQRGTCTPLEIYAQPHVDKKQR